MITFMIPSHLAILVREDTRGETRARSLPFDPGNWREFAGQLRDRCPGIAQRVLTDRDEIAPGFALIVNEAVVQDDPGTITFRSGDELTIIAALAGG